MFLLYGSPFFCAQTEKTQSLDGTHEAAVLCSDVKEPPGAQLSVQDQKRNAVVAALADSNHRSAFGRFLFCKNEIARLH